MDGVVMVSDMAWIQRGVAKEVPDKIKLTAEELKQLVEGGVPVESEHDSSDNEEKMDGENEKTGGLRGSEASKDVEMEDEDADFDEKYMKAYDNKEEVHGGNGMRGIAMFASNKDDPYVTNQVDSDEEEEKDEIVVRRDDNMVVLSKIDKGDFNLECYVYNEADNDWYCHHHYILDAPPLCLEPVQHDPGNEETGKVRPTFIEICCLFGGCGN
ncbi:unnamed protein product [Caenorhabditis bovis]|uniref:Uncharacterized protein n=1 Tax=Caenorhabditis bovis TaxID=2654633 RepID=A0A8S1F1G5_9PELO|nr:unnamed protein product [Caenorhabditis bovis]